MTMGTANAPLLVDTNIWLDYFNENRPGFADAVELILFAESKGVPLLVAVTSLKDFYYLQANIMKQELRDEYKGQLSEEQAAAAEEYAWACVQNIGDFAATASMGLPDVEMSRSLRKIHRDFEDDLLIAAAIRCNARYLVTNNKRLRHKSPVPAMSSRDTLAMLQM